jgi:hypothetical protein
LLYIPDSNSDIEDVFKQCEKLQCNVDTTVIPVIYTSQDAAHFSISKDVNLLADQYYIAPKKELLQGTVKKVIDGIVYPKNVLAQGFGARFFSRFNEIGIESKKPALSNLFLSAPILEKNFFSPKNKVDSVSGPAASVKNVFNRLEKRKKTVSFNSDLFYIFYISS